MKILQKDFYNREADIVAQDLLGKYLVHKVNGIEKIGMIVETEAYMGPHDLAAHSSKGLTPRTKTLYETVAHSYVYLIYGLHYLFNITTGTPGAAVLIRSLEPIKNIDKKTNGPALLTKAMDISKTQHGLDITKGNLFVTESEIEKFEIVASKRIGVDYAKEWKDKPFRFYIKENAFISKK